jgi:LuxR family maltose regulon positive regulatory protein
MNAQGAVVLETSSALLLHPAAPAPAPPPPPARGSVPRTRLVRRLVAAADARVALLVAPAGYGKSTLLSEWALRDERPFACVSLDDARENATERVIEQASRARQVIVVDDAHRARPAAVAALLDAAEGLPDGTTLALAARARPRGPIGRLRAHHQLVEVTADDLAMSRLEAAMLVDATGLRLGAAQLDGLLERTQGWPAALYLAARLIAEAADPEAAYAAFRGAERPVAEFLRDDALAALTPAQRVFLRRTAILARVTAPACDDLLGTRGSGALLAELGRRGVPMTALDPCELSFAYHPLLVEMLRAEREWLEPEREPELHRRAARWHARDQRPDEALPHAVACGDLALAGRLLWSMTLTAAAENRTDELGAHLERFDDRAVAAEPTLALSAAVHHLAAGRRAPAERATDTAQRSLPADDPAVALLRACLARDGMTGMAADSARARAGLAPWSPWHALALLLEGVAAHLSGDAEAAVPALEEAAARAGRKLPAIAALAHAQLALVDADRDAWDDAKQHADEAHASLGLAAPTAVGALVLAAAAVVAAQRGDIAQARLDAADAERLLTLRGDFAPWLIAEAEIWLARAQLQLSDGPASRSLLARAARLQPLVAGDHALARWIHDGWARADAFAEHATGDGPSLTNAELRVLRLLPSHMSFREIGERLHVSTNTVKTQALAVYRKLDVSCRSDAVARGRSAGLIGP